MRIARNIPAMYVQTNLNRTDKKLSLLSNQMSTGLRITSVKDDASGYAISTKLENQIRGLEKASKNSLDGVSMTQTVDGALGTMTDMIQRARELSVQASNDSNSQQDRQKIQREIDQVLAEIDTMQNSINFNGKKIIGGDASRITYDLDSAGAEQNVAGISHVSSAVPEGSLKYDITSPGSPGYAQVTLPSGTTPLGVEGSFVINGLEIEYSKSDTADDLKSKTLEAFDWAGLNYENGYLYTGNEGSDQTILFEGDYSMIGITVVGVTAGTDAVLSNVEYVDPDGNPIDSFNSNMVLMIEGNDISIVSTNSQVIEMDINFAGIDSTGNLIFGDIDNPSKQQVGVSGSFKSDVTNYGGIIIQTGENKDMETPVFIRELNTEELGIENIKVTTREDATNAIAAFDNALSIISDVRSVVGSYQNRFQSTVENLDSATINTQTSLSRIRDVDLAEAMISYSTEEVKLNAAMSILQQANERPQSILQLL